MPTELNTAAIAAIRTGVASLVGIFIAYLVSKGIDLGEEFAVSLTTLVTVAAIAAYNYVVVLLEKNVNEKFGFLLGIPKAPTYKG